MRALLAWRSIESDGRELRMTLDNLQARQATQYREQTHETVLRLVRETFKWLIAPAQSLKRDGRMGEIEWEAYPLNPASAGLGKEVERVCAENELVVVQWAPIHLHNLLKRWFWKEDMPEVPAQDVWQKSCQYLYFPRLASSSVMQTTIGEGAISEEYFGLATAKEGDAYRGFSFGKTAAIYMDALLLIEPTAAAKYAARMKAAEPGAASASSAGAAAGPGTAVTAGAPSGRVAPASGARPKRYFGTVELDPVRASLQFANIQKELIGLFTSDAGTRVRIKVDIEAENAQGFDETTVRAGKENGKTLGLDSSSFE